MTNKEKYREFCKKEKDIPIFSKDWWLDTVCQESDWDVVLFEKGGEIWASLPYQKTKKAIFEIITMPKLTQTMGVYIKYPPKQKYYKKLSWEKEVMEILISNLPKVDYFSQNFDHSITNWLPFYWAGFEQTTRYTYIIENISIEELEKNFETDIRRRRRKAYEIGIKIIESEDIETFYKLNTMTFARKNIGISYSFEFVKNLFEKCKENSAVKMYFAKYQDEVIAVNFLVYDDNTVYYLMGGIDPSKKDLGAMDAIQFESIKFALESGRRFDFEGSMIESIEKYFRSFGAIQTPYFSISKTNSKLLKIRKLIKEILFL
ncbi:GNAT family N-acetyltransferase [Aliarcobacter cryaerophilus]|uniref:GNAT family N-acetyltransferase n=1 Tax=Aliarcobacter cryaerophilus TaxID=28198 RepID=UPI0021B3FF7D|nr:GNAT family N-acetyltransferase [Aliarcobacter cryaerophilus]MCT7506070.1 GNAT family N-acetyltransferase [Aliarcobacter cryaerophilus]